MRAMKAGLTFRLATAALAVAAVLGGCSTNPITGRSQLIGLVSEGEAVQGSTKAYQQMMAELDKKQKLEKSGEKESPRTQKIQQITDRLIAQAIKFRPNSASWRWEVRVIDDPKTVNAFCMAGGKMAIYTGMWEQLKATDDELAQVMGHEISHALLDHTRERMSVARAYDVGVQILAAAAGVGNLGGQAMDAAAQIAITLPNSRESEAEADAVGTQIAARAGFDPHAAVTLAEKIAKLGSGGKMEFLSTHPAPENRAAKLKELAGKLEPVYHAAKTNPPVAQRYVNLPVVALGGRNERAVEPPLGANERVVKPAPTSQVK